MGNILSGEGAPALGTVATNAPPPQWNNLGENPALRNARLQSVVTAVRVVNNAPPTKMGATIYDRHGQATISFFGESFCQGAGCIVEGGQSQTFRFDSGADNDVIGIQWNTGRLAPNGRNCDNPCRQMTVDLQSCTFHSYVTDPSTYCYVKDGVVDYSPRWNPEVSMAREGSTCVLTVTSDSSMELVSGREPDVCGCNWGNYPCICGSSPDGVCAGQCPATDANQVCQGSGASHCCFCSGGSSSCAATAGPAPRTTPAAPAPSSSGGQTCDDVWNTDAGGHSCGGRIEWVRDNQGKSLEEAKRQIAHEFPSQCGPCGSSGGRGGATPVTPAAPAPHPPSSSDGQTCDDVWNTNANGHTCGGRIEWVRDNQGKSLEEAKRQIAHEFPNECGACAGGGSGGTPAAPSPARTAPQAQVVSVGDLSGTASGPTSLADDPFAVCPTTPQSANNRGPRLIVSNTLSRPVDIWVNGQVNGRAVFASGPLPCLRQVPSGSGATLYLPAHAELSIFAESPYRDVNKSQFEIKLGDGPIFWDISYNAGFDVPMSIISPEGDRHITSTRNSPDAYTFVDRAGRAQENCAQIQPCIANNFMLDPSYDSPSYTFQMFVGPVPDPDNPGRTLPDSPGKLGCTPPVGFECSDHGAGGCTTSGNGLFCWQAGRGQCASSARVVCWDGGVKPGTGSCPASC